jgi:hypothetical protein
MNSTRTHPLNVSYLVVGLVFLGLAGSWGLRQAGVVDFAEVRWLLPLTLLGAGLVGIVAMAVKGLSGRDGNPTHESYDHTYEGEDR